MCIFISRQVYLQRTLTRFVTAESNEVKTQMQRENNHTEICEQRALPVMKHEQQNIGHS